MTDRTTITINADWDLMIRPHTDGILLSLLPVRDTPAHVTVPVATGALLAAIDAADPDAMRAYLRETAPEVIADLYRPEIPEADSPEDVDEHPDRDDPTERAQLDRAWAMERAAEVLGRLIAVTGAPGGEVQVIGYASWILTGSTETLDR